MNDFFMPNMSPFFLVFSSLLFVVWIVLGMRVRGRLLLKKTDTQTSYHSILSEYREMVDSFFKEKDARSVEAFSHYVITHLLIPFCGFAFFLRTDANFLVVIVAIVWSLQLLQRIYPGVEAEE